MTYMLYRDETACDSDDWGPPTGEYPTLLEAMAAAGFPDPVSWEIDRHCPDEVFIVRGSEEGEDEDLYLSILAPGAAAEARALAGAA